MHNKACRPPLFGAVRPASDCAKRSSFTTKGSRIKGKQYPVGPQCLFVEPSFLYAKVGNILDIINFGFIKQVGPSRFMEINDQRPLESPSFLSSRGTGTDRIRTVTELLNKSNSDYLHEILRRFLN